MHLAIFVVGLVIGGLAVGFRARVWLALKTLVGKGGSAQPPAQA